MNTRDTVVQIILDALTDLNKELPEAERVAVAEDTLLFGTDASLDSLSLVSVIVDVEGGVATQFSTPVALTDDEAMSQEISPFSSVTILADYIVKKLASG